MTITFPRDFPPGIKIAEGMINLAPNQAIFKSSFTGDTQTQNHDAGKADKWEGVYVTSLLSVEDVATTNAFLFSLNGTENTFKAFIPDHKRPLLFDGTDFTFDSDEVTFDSLLETFDQEDFPGSAVVWKNPTSSTSIETRSWNYASATVLLAGDYFQINEQLYMALEDVTTTPSRTATINFRPPMRVFPEIDDLVITKQPVMIARLSQQYDGTRTGNDKKGVISFTFEEAL